jgi:hypothetical protein
MVYEISRREVMNNLIRFKDSLSELHREDERRQGQGEEKEEKKGERTYKVLLNRKTGDMRFAQKISTIEHRISIQRKKESAEDWKEVQIVVRQKSDHDTAHFEMLDTKKHSLIASELDPLAWRIAKETLDVLNQKVKEVKPGDLLPEEAVLQDLTSIHLESHKERIENMPGWMGSLGRIEAEERLRTKLVGTYLLREGDEITISISFQFSQQNHLFIHPYVLTVVEKEDKISDILLLKTDKGWILYCDDPDLSDTMTYHYYPSPQSLLRSLSHIATQPLL